MGKKTIFFFLVLLLFLIGVAYSSTLIKLKHGTNEVFIKVSNACDVDLESISLIITNEDLPEGITASINFQTIDVPANQKGENGLIIK